VTGRARTAPGPITLAVDVGGSGPKVMRLGPRGAPVSERLRVATPRPATPRAVLAAIGELAAAAGSFDRVAIGFPGVVEEGVVRSAPNLDGRWAGVELAARVRALTGKPARALNDAGVQGLGAIEGRGVEACVTLGTGMGFSLFVDGAYVPNIELGHHPFARGQSYEDLVGEPALQRVGKKRWRRRVEDVLEQIRATFNPRAIYVGGGNARLLRALPAGATVVPNVTGLLGGVRMWQRETRASAAKR
jgi:polyphosphate glucokinase